MPEVEIKRAGWKCARCGHIWEPIREGKPTVCPRCHSPYWDRPRVTVAQERSCRHCYYVFVPRVLTPHRCPNCMGRWPLGEPTPQALVEEPVHDAG